MPSIAVRFFIKPDGKKYVDVVMPEGLTMMHVANIMQNEGFIVSPFCFVPHDSVLFASTLASAEMEATTKPTLSIFPGGRPPEAS